MISRKFVMLALPVLAFVIFFDAEDMTSQYLRRLATHCIHNVYTDVTLATTMPQIPEENSETLPAYLALCQEWIRHDAYYNETNPYEKYRIVEDEETCMDWSSPHLSMLELFAGLLVTHKMPRIKYRHNCDRTRTFDEAAYGFDYTTIQQIFNTPGLAIDATRYTTEELKQQCRRCLVAYDPSVETARVKAKGVHHCLVFPDDGGRDLNPNGIPVTPDRSVGTVALSAAHQAVRSRLYHSAMEWQTVTDKPPQEEESGTIIWIDPTSVGLPFAEMANYVEHPSTSISILAGPTCATATLATGEICHEYAQGLADFLNINNPQSADGGYYEGEHGVTFKIVTSTAAAFSRMILSGRLLCPPRTPTCYLPALAKQAAFNQEAVLLEDPDWQKSTDFFSAMGAHGVVQIKHLDVIPPTYTQDPPQHRREQDGLASPFQVVNSFVDHEGYPGNLPTSQDLPSDETLNGMTDQQILDDIAIAIDRFQDNPNVYKARLELIPTLDQIQKAIAEGRKITINDLLDDTPQMPQLGNGFRTDQHRFRHGELATDADSDFLAADAVGVEYWEHENTQRHDSLLRIQHDWEVSFMGHAQYEEYGDPSTLYEIHCPSTGPDGTGDVTYIDGTVTTHDGAELVISDGSSGIEVKDANTQAIVGTGIGAVDLGVAYVGTNTNGYYIKDGSETDESGYDPTPLPERRTLKRISAENQSADFLGAMEKICETHKRRRLEVEAMEEQHAATKVAESKAAALDAEMYMMT